MNKEHEQQRKELWCAVYVAYVGAANTISADGAKGWADKALKAFDERFPTPRED